MTAGVVLGTIALVLAVIGLGIFLDRRRVSILPRPGDFAEPPRPPTPPDPPGTTPKTALRLTTDRLDRALAAQICTGCRGLMSPGDGEPIRFGEKSLRLFPLRCEKCGAARGLYVELVS